MPPCQALKLGCLWEGGFLFAAVKQPDGWLGSQAMQTTDEDDAVGRSLSLAVKTWMVVGSQRRPPEV